MRIDWSNTTLSNHQRLRLTQLLDELGDTGTFDPILPIEGGARLIFLGRIGAPEGFDFYAQPHPRLSYDPDAEIDYAKHHRFRIPYQYRSSSNYKLSGAGLLEGALTPVDLALIHTALGGMEGLFIPSQIDLEDLQFSAGWEVDFENEDHVWHDYHGIHPIQGDEPALDMASFLADCRKVLQSGWDDEAAIARLSEQ